MMGLKETLMRIIQSKSLFYWLIFKSFRYSDGEQPFCLCIIRQRFRGIRSCHSFQTGALTSLPHTGLPVEDPPATFFQNREILQNPLIPFISPDISQNTRRNSDGLNASPAIPFGMLLEHISTKMVLIL